MNKIDEYLASLPTWQRTNLELFRKLVHEVEPSITEDWKWNVPVFLINNKMYFAMSAFKEHTKYNFILNGAVINDPNKLFNNGLESKKSRGIDLREDQTINESDLKALIKMSVNN
jgi:hypothetical protein